MRKVLFTIGILIVFNTFSYSQKWETAGGAVIDFLLTNPKTARRTNATETAALSVIGSLLNKSAQRKHEMNVAKAGKSEIVINTNNGNKSTIYSDVNGNVYLLHNGTIYPISTGLVNQARSEQSGNNSAYSAESSAILPYDLNKLKNSFVFDKKTKYTEKKGWRRYDMGTACKTLSEIASINNVSKDDIYFVPVKFKKQQEFVSEYKYNIPRLLSLASGSRSKKIFNEIYWSKRRICYNHRYRDRNDSYADDFTNRWSFRIPGFEELVHPSCFQVWIRTTKRTSHSFYPFKTVSVFSCNWAKDFDGKGYSFEDFKGVKRSFFKDESILFVCGYTSESPVNSSFEIYKASTGKLYQKTSGVHGAGAVSQLIFRKLEKQLPPGTYIYNFLLENSDGKKISASEKFEVTKPDQSKR